MARKSDSFPLLPLSAFNRVIIPGRNRRKVPANVRAWRGNQMSDFDRNYATATRSVGADRALIDAGLRAYMVRVYNYMTLGLAATGVVAWFAYQAAGGEAIRRTAGGIVGLTPFGVTIFTGFTPIILMLATLGIVFFISF